MKYKLIIDENAADEITLIVREPSALTLEIEDLIRRYQGFDCIVGYNDDEMRKLAFEQIECITVINRRVVAIDTDGNRYTLKDRLRDLEAVLPSYFIRINKSTIANDRRILRFDAAFSGGVDAVFYCGYKEYVSRRCFSEIKRRYEEK